MKPDLHVTCSYKFSQLHVFKSKEYSLRFTDTRIWILVSRNGHLLNLDYLPGSKSTDTQVGVNMSTDFNPCTC